MPESIKEIIARIFGGHRVHRYLIGGKTYVQQPLVLGQIRQLLDLLQGTSIPLDAGAVGMITALGSKLPIALAIVLVEEGKSPEDKELEALAAAIEFVATPAMALEVADDFLACNPLSLLLERLAGMMSRIGALVTTGSPNSAFSSPTGTSQGATASSGE